MTNVDSILKSRDIITITNKGPHSQSYVFFFPVVMYQCETWTIKKAECWRIDAFELWCWKRLLRVPWTARGSNQLILKEISPEYTLEGLKLKQKLKLQYLGNLMWRTHSLEKSLMLGKIEGMRRSGQQRMRWLDNISDSMDMTLDCPGDSEGQGGLVSFSPWSCKESDMTRDWAPNNKSLEELMLKLKFQYLGNLMWRTDSLEKTSMLRDWRQKDKGVTEDEMVR